MELLNNKMESLFAHHKFLIGMKILISLIIFKAQLNILYKITKITNAIGINLVIKITWWTITKGRIDSNSITCQTNSWIITRTACRMTNANTSISIIIKFLHIIHFIAIISTTIVLRR